MNVHRVSRLCIGVLILLAQMYWTASQEARAAVDESILLREYPALSQLDPANYQKAGFAEQTDVAPNGQVEPVKKLACVATVYTMVARGRGDVIKTIDLVYVLGKGAIPPSYVRPPQAVSVTQIVESLRQRRPVILEGEGGVLGAHSVLVVGFERTASSITISALDPWPKPGTIRPGRPATLKAAIDAKSISYPQLGVTFGVMRMVDDGVAKAAPAQPVSQEPPVPASAPVLTFRMKDGSTVSGQVQAESIKVKSSVGTATVPVKDIVSFSDGQLRLQDGSVLKGELAVSSLAVASKYGALQLSAKDIVWFGVGTPPAVAAAPSASSTAPPAKPPSSASAPVAPSAPPAPPSAQSGSAIPIPRQYGVYLVAGGQLMELREEESEGVGLNIRGGFDSVSRCCESDRHINVPNNEIKILVYQRGLPDFKPDLRGYFFVRKLKVITDYVAGTSLRVQETTTTVNRWMADPERSYITKIAPVSGQQDMVLIETTGKYAPGLYGLQLNAQSIPPFRFPRQGWAVFRVVFSDELKDQKCEDWVSEDLYHNVPATSWLRLPRGTGEFTHKVIQHPCSANAVPEADGKRWISSSGQSASIPGPTVAVPPGSTGGAGQIIKVQFVNESSGPVRLQITGNSQIAVGGQRWVTIDPGKSDEIPVMIGQQKLRVEKVRTAGPVVLWAGFRREKTVEIAPDKSVQIRDDDFK